MKLSDKRKFKKAVKQIQSFQAMESFNVEEANTTLEELIDNYPHNPKIMFQYAVTQNSLGNKDVALQILAKCIDLNPDDEDARCIYPTILLESVDSIEDSELFIWKDKLLKVANWGFDSVGFDLGTFYKLLAKIETAERNNEQAIYYLEKAKDIYRKDSFLCKSHIDSGEIDDLIKSLK